MGRKESELQMDKVRSAEMSWREVEAAVRAGKAAIFPIGSTEEHGPHSPTGDYMVTDEIAARVASQTGDVVFPCLPFGYSEYFRHYPGTITLQHDTLFRLLEDVISGLISHGFRHIVLFNGHGGNQPIVSVLLRKIRRDHGLLVPAVSPLGFAKPEFKREVYAGAKVEHGGAGMAAYMMYLRPGTVDLSLAEDWGKKDFHGLPADLSGVVFDGSQVSLSLNMEDITPPSGSLSDPRLATAERGERIIQHTVERLVRFMQWFKGIDPRIQPG